MYLTNNFNIIFSGNLGLDNIKLITVMKLNKLSVNENMWNNVTKTIEDSLQIEKVTSFYQISKCFNF